MQHKVDHLFGRRHVPARQRSLRTRADGRREDRAGRDGQLDTRSSEPVIVVYEGDGERGFEVGFARRVGWKDVECPEHVFVGLRKGGREFRQRWAKSAIKQTLSSPAQKISSASGFRYRIRLTISPLFTANGRTSRFFFPTSTSIGRLRAKLFSNKSWHCLHWNNLQPTRISIRTLRQLAKETKRLTPTPGHSTGNAT